MTLTQDPTHATGVTDDSPRGSGSLVRSRDRKANAALQLRIAGAAWDEIAETLGFPDGRAALVATERALERELQTEGSKAHMRALNSRRLERLLRSSWAKATNPEHPDHLLAMREVRATLAQQAKLQGLDAPTEYVVTSPTQNELEKWVQAALSAQSPAFEEVDIFDADVLYDSEDPDQPKALVNDPSSVTEPAQDD